MEAAGVSRGSWGCVSCWGSYWLEEALGEVGSVAVGWPCPAPFPLQGPEPLPGWPDGLGSLGRGDGAGPRHGLALCAGHGSCRVPSPWYRLGAGAVGERFPHAEQLGKPSVSQPGTPALLGTWWQPDGEHHQGLCARGLLWGARRGRAQLGVIRRRLRVGASSLENIPSVRHESVAA